MLRSSQETKSHASAADEYVSMNMVLQGLWFCSFHHQDMVPCTCPAGQQYTSRFDGNRLVAKIWPGMTEAK